jgi:N-methylhydantoinase B/oxoprolinase/acetone carboxylase alpha subunit
MPIFSGGKLLAWSASKGHVADIGGMTAGGYDPRTRNEDDVSLQVRLFQAEALERQGMNEAALEAYKDALRSTKRDDELLKAARWAPRR